MWLSNPGWLGTPLLRPGDPFGFTSGDLGDTDSKSPGRSAHPHLYPAPVPVKDSEDKPDFRLTAWNQDTPPIPSQGHGPAQTPRAENGGSQLPAAPPSGPRDADQSIRCSNKTSKTVKKQNNLSLICLTCPRLLDCYGTVPPPPPPSSTPLSLAGFLNAPLNVTTRSALKSCSHQAEVPVATFCCAQRLTFPGWNFHHIYSLCGASTNGNDWCRVKKKEFTDMLTRPLKTQMTS